MLQILTFMIPDDSSTIKQCQKMYEEQVLWAKEAGVDFVIAETINWVGEMKIALEAIKKRKYESL